MLTDSTTPYTIEVEIEAWQNERYRSIFGGWGAPVQSDASFFSDLSGTIEVPFVINGQNQSVPYSQLPPGWQWSNEWQVETTCAFGYVDTIDGWGYSSTFKRLFSNTLKGVLDGEKKSMSLVRRRRWTRKRVCLTPEAKSHFIARYEWMQLKRETMIRFVQLFSMDSQQVIIYEEKRKPGVKESEEFIIASLKETAGMLDGVWTKLQLLKGFLVERGAIEKEYALRLHHLSKKWINAGGGGGERGGNSDESDNTSTNGNDRAYNEEGSRGQNNVDSNQSQRNDVLTPVKPYALSLSEDVAIISSPSMDDAEASDDNNYNRNYNYDSTGNNNSSNNNRNDGYSAAALGDLSESVYEHPRTLLDAEESLPKGFFFTINTAGTAVADQLMTFANILTSTLPTDIDSLMAEIKSIFQDVCLEEGAKIRERWVKAHERLHNRFLAYQAAVKVVTDSLAYKSSRLHHHLFHETATLNVGNNYSSLGHPAESVHGGSQHLGSLSPAAAAAVSFGGIAVTYDTNSDKLVTQHSYLDSRSLDDIVGRDRNDSTVSMDSSYSERLSNSSPGPFMTPPTAGVASDARYLASLNYLPRKSSDSFEKGNSIAPLSPFGNLTTSTGNGSNQAAFAYNLAIQYQQAYMKSASVDRHDLWLLLQVYRLSVLECQGITAMYVAFVNRQRKVTENLIGRVSILLKAAVNHFSSQLSMAWLEPIAFLNEIADIRNEGECDDMEENEEDGMASIDGDHHSRLHHRSRDSADRGSNRGTVTSSHSRQSYASASRGPQHNNPPYNKSSFNRLSQGTGYNDNSSNSDGDGAEDDFNNNLNRATSPNAMQALSISLGIEAEFDALNVRGYVAKLGKVKYCKPVTGPGASSSSATEQFPSSSSSSSSDNLGQISSMLSPSSIKRQQQPQQSASQKYDWKDGVAVLTCTYMLHILAPTDDVLGDTLDDADGGSSDSQWISQEPILSINVADAFVEPILMSLGGDIAGDAFVIHARNNGASDNNSDKSMFSSAASMANMNISANMSSLSPVNLDRYNPFGSSSHAASLTGSNSPLPAGVTGNSGSSSLPGNSSTNNNGNAINSNANGAMNGGVTSSVTVISSSNMGGVNSYSNGTTPREIPETLAVMVKNSSEAGAWMRIISNPFVHTDRDLPSGEQDEDEFRKEVQIFYKASLEQ